MFALKHEIFHCCLTLEKLIVLYNCAMWYDSSVVRNNGVFVADFNVVPLFCTL